MHVNVWAASCKRFIIYIVSNYLHDQILAPDPRSLLYCYTAICSHVWLRAIYRRMLRLNQSRAPYCKAGHLYTVDSPNWLESRV